MTLRDLFPTLTWRTRTLAAAACSALVVFGSSACDRAAVSETPATTDGTSSLSKDAPGAHDDHPQGVVTLDTAGIRLGGIVVGVAEVYTTTGLPVTGSITYDANRVSHIGARTQGRVVKLRADLGVRVRRGQVLALLESPEVGQIRAQHHEAQALVRIAQENYTREQRLEEQGISSRKELLYAEANLRREQAAQQSAEERLRVLGAGEGTGGEFAIVSPFDGVIVARDVSLGEMAGPETTLFTVADLSRVWIELDIFERDLVRVKKGQSATVTVAAHPGRTFPGRIVYIGDIFDPAKRTARARVELRNDDGALKPGMFAEGTIQIGSNGNIVAVVPQAAVQEIDGRRVVFVPGAANGEFRAVEVEVGESIENDRVVILRGVAPKAAVVTVGAFVLRSELQKEELAEEDH